MTGLHHQLANMTSVSREIKQLRFLVPRSKILPILSSTSIGVQTDLHGDISIASVGDSSPAAIRSFVYLHGLASARVGEKSEALLQRFVQDESSQEVSSEKIFCNCFTRFDFRGHGESTAHFDFEHDFTVSGALDDTAAVLNHVDELLDCDLAMDYAEAWHQAYANRHVLIGYSLGALVATKFAAEVAPERVAALVLLAPGFGFWERTERLLLNETNGVETLNVNRVCIPSSYVPDGQIVLGNRFVQDLREQWGSENWDSESAEVSFAQSLRDNDIPVLVIAGKDDEVVDWRLAAKLVDAVNDSGRKSKRSKLVLLEGENHRLNTSRDIIAAEIIEFVSDAWSQ